MYIDNFCTDTVSEPRAETQRWHLVTKYIAYATEFFHGTPSGDARSGARFLQLLTDIVEGNLLRDEVASADTPLEIKIVLHFHHSYVVGHPENVLEIFTVEYIRCARCRKLYQNFEKIWTLQTAGCRADGFPKELKLGRGLVLKSELNHTAQNTRIRTRVRMFWLKITNTNLTILCRYLWKS